MNTPTSKVAAVAMGAVEIYGKAKPITLLKSPLKKAPCAYYKTDVYSFERRGKHSDWVLIKSYTDGIKFLIEDETGSIMVDASWMQPLMPAGVAQKLITPNMDGAVSGAFFDIATDHSFETRGEGLKQLPKEVQDFFADSRISYEKENFLGLFNQNAKLKIVEKYLAVGDMVYVFGSAQPLENKSLAGEATVRDAFIGVKKGETFYISDRSEKEILKGGSWQAPLAILGGIVLICLGAAALIAEVGGINPISFNFGVK